MKRMFIHLTLAAIINLTWMIYLLVSTEFWLPKDLCDSSLEFGAIDILGSGLIGCFVNVDIAVWYFFSGVFLVLPYSVVFGEAAFYAFRALFLRVSGMFRLRLSIE
jgi:hypothetical protein